MDQLRAQLAKVHKDMKECDFELFRAAMQLLESELHPIGKVRKPGSRANQYNGHNMLISMCHAIVRGRLKPGSVMMQYMADVVYNINWDVASNFRWHPQVKTLWACVRAYSKSAVQVLGGRLRPNTCSARTNEVQALVDQDLLNLWAPCESTLIDTMHKYTMQLACIPAVPNDPLVSMGGMEQNRNK